MAARVKLTDLRERVPSALNHMRAPVLQIKSSTSPMKTPSTFKPYTVESPDTPRGKKASNKRSRSQWPSPSSVSQCSNVTVRATQRHWRRLASKLSPNSQENRSWTCGAECQWSRGSTLSVYFLMSWG